MPPERHTILYFSSFGNFRWGGQKSLYHLATRLDRSIYRPHVVVPSEDGLADALRKADVGVTVLELPVVTARNARRITRSLGAIDGMIDALDARILHTDGPRNTFYAGLAGRRRRRPVVWHIRASDRDGYDRLLYGLSSRVVLVARALRSRFGWARGNGKFTVIYNGVDTQQFQPAVDPSRRLIGQMGIDSRRIVIASLTRVEPSKGQMGLIEACAALRHVGADFHVVLAGEIADENYCLRCRSRAQEMGIAERVTFAGYVEDAARFLAEVDIVAVSSVSGEAFPRTTIESMAAGRPVIVTAVGGAPEAVEEGVTGFIVAPRDVEAFRKRVVRLVQDAGLRKQMGEAARNRAEALFSITGNVQKTQALYEEILGSLNRG